ncbi:hypothetical protein [Geopseudomonas aromaticivorans]|nr:hypothetical protein [Pseudomonas aromaticivorans]
MNQQVKTQAASIADSRADAWAALSLIMIGVATVILWVSQQ